MKLDYTYYKKDVPYNVGKREPEIIKYIKENIPENYENIIKNDSSEETISALSIIRNNIICAYDFKPNSTVLELGAHLGEVTNILCEKTSKVVSVESVKSRAEAISIRCKEKENLSIFVGSIKDIKLEEKFDYITLFGVLEYAQIFFQSNNPVNDLIKYCKLLLKEDGKILIATNNKFALKSYVGDIDECTNITFDSITGYRSNTKTYKMGKHEIERVLQEEGFNFYKFFYPLPDYKLPNTIFSDEYLPTTSQIDSYFPYYNDNSSIFFSEVDAFNAIIKDDKELFKFFSNSYLIETSQISFTNDTKFISFNNYRKEKYRLMTKIGNKTVEKRPLNLSACNHIENMKQIIEQINKDNLNILDRYENGKIISEFINDKLVSQKINDNIEDKKFIIDILNRFKENISKQSCYYDECDNTVFDKYSVNVDEDTLRKFKFLKNGYWDMIFKNCFLIDDKFVFFDQEWKERNIPVDFLIYRCIVNIERLRDKIDEYNIYKEVGIYKYIDIFKQLDEKITKEIFDGSIFDLYTRKHPNPIYDNAVLRQELNKEYNKNNKLEEEVQGLSIKLQDLVKNVKSLSKELEDKNYKNQELQNELNRIYESRSYKITAKIKSFFK